MTTEVMTDKGENHSAIARMRGVTEGTVRYHLRRRADGTTDGRQKLFKAEVVAEAAPILGQTLPCRYD